MNNSSRGELDSEDTLDMVNLDKRMAVLPVTILIGVENFVGLIGNSLILLVYSRRYEKSNFRCFVLFMAFIDLTSCLTCVPGEIFSQLNWYKYEHSWICKLKSYFNVLGAWGSASILSLLAFDRYRKLCHPFASQMQPSTAFKLCLTAIIVSAFVAVPSTVLWGKQTYVYQMGDSRITVSVCEKSSEFAEKTHYTFMYIVCVYILPIGLMMVIVTTLNVITTRRLFCERNIQFMNTLTVSKLSSSKNLSQATLDTYRGSHSSLEDIGTGSYIETSVTSDYLRKETHPESAMTPKPLSSELSSHVQNMIKPNVSFIDLHDIMLITDSRNIATPDQLDGPSKTSTRTHSAVLVDQIISVARSSSLPDDRLVSASHSRSGKGHDSITRTKRKTIIMLVLTTVFVVTMSVYVILVSLIAERNILQTLANSEKAIYFLFLRLYFINCLINPFLYGVMDPRFRNGIREMFLKKQPIQ